MGVEGIGEGGGEGRALVGDLNVLAEGVELVMVFMRGGGGGREGGEEGF